MTEIRHVIVTRFSMKLGAHAGAFPEGWLSHRVSLLERYCVPGLAAQSCPGFTWLLLCDISTDPDILAQLDALRVRVPQLRVGVIDAGRHWRETLADVVGPSADVVMTTRLDSDDALNVNAVDALQDYARLFAPSDLETLVVNFERGWQLDTETGTVSERWYPHSPFLTLLERPREGHGLRGVMHTSHTKLPYHHPAHHDLSIVGWLQVVHGGNVTNSIVDAGLDVPEADLTRFGIHDRRGSAGAR